mmetsp:Transcript_20664/g.39232  ORF Transcript_20664/g.39232 Transcript_20664/m.39232 type:complete len:771 (-) Transcript_20664:222-2534(-)
MASLGDFGKKMSQAWQDSTARTTQALQQAQEAMKASSAAQAIQESTTNICVVCQKPWLKPLTVQCPECSKPCCQGCLTRIMLFNPTGISSLADPGRSVQVCSLCVPTARQKHRRESVQERMKRVTAFLEGCLEPYRYCPESKVDQSYRLGGHVMHGVKQVAGYLPIAGQAVAAINAGYYLVRYGPLVLTGNDVLICLQMLVSMSKKLDLLPVLHALPQDLFGGLYYQMAEMVGERGKTPELELLEHVDSRGAVPRPSPELLARLRQLIRLLFVTTYGDQTPTDAQRLLRQVLPGGELVLAELSITRDIPSYFLACVRAEKKAYLILPGTKDVGDIATDLNAEEEKLLHGSAHKGMVQSARWLLGEVSPVLVHLYTQGYQVTIVGHSLGAAVAALLTIMLRPQISNLFCYGYGTPACVDERLMASTFDCMVSVVNRDDVVPRLTVQNVETLTKSALCPGQKAKTQKWMEEDWKAVKDVERVIELRRRERDSAGKETIAEMTAHHDEKVRRLCEAGLTEAVAIRALEQENGDLDLALLRATHEEVEGGSSASAAEAAEFAPKQRRSAADVVQEHSQKIFGGLQQFGAAASAQVQALTEQGAARLRQASASGADAVQKSGSVREVAVSAQAHTRFYIPGQVVHLYQQNGLARAALASNTSETFARIVPCANLLEDHPVKAYDEVLRQACIAEPRAPKWESFSDRAVCACCNSDFNWAYVLSSEPQKMLARHHCFRCGQVVCDGCSQTRRSWPQIGFNMPVRTCDKCIYGPGSD